MDVPVVISLQDSQQINGHHSSSDDHDVFAMTNGNPGNHAGHQQNGLMKNKKTQAELKAEMESRNHNSDPDFSDEIDEESEPESEENDDIEELEQAPRKKAKIDNGNDSNVRKSARERKVPKKFLTPEKKEGAKRKYTRKNKNGVNEGAKKGSSKTSSNADSEEDIESEEEEEDEEGVEVAPVEVKQLASAKRKVVRQKKRKADEDDYSDFSDEDKTRGWKRSIKDNGVKAKSKPGRKKEKKKYEEGDIDHSSDFATDQEDNNKVQYIVQEVEEVDIIEFVLDHRIGKVGATGANTMHWSVQIDGNPLDTLDTQETEQQFLIKWKGWSHINNTWESDDSLAARKKGSQEVKGLRKLINYQNKLADFEAWKRKATPEDIEYQDIEIEMGREILKSYMEIERIFATQKNESGGKDYFVKWKNLAYSEATWEDEFNITNYYQDALEEYTERLGSRTMPKNYDSAMKGVSLKFTPMREQPDFIGSDTFRLRDYQIEGVNFVLNAWSRGNSVILADEMGLGKTIQTICFLKYLWHTYPFKGPMLVCVPLSTMAAWQKEFAQWAPQMNTVTYIGNAASREIIRNHEMFSKSGQIIFNVLLTNYEMVVKDRDHFSAVKWSNIVVDEAHRLKSEDSLLYKVLLTVESKHRLLLTGTPLQNSLKELWCLLSYIKPVNFEDWETFSANYGTDEDKATGYIKLHTLLKPYIIRRLKKDVEKSLPGKVEQILRVDMTVRQKKIYRLVLTKNFEALSKGKNQVSLLNILMQLRKTCNHAELLQELDEGPSNNPAERLKQLIYGSGKLLLLDKLLTRFREKGDRVLIFSQMVKLLDLLEEYLSLKRYPFQRLDGSVNADKRKQSIAAFNDEKSMDFCFLLSTKAGGLGINLQTANRVIIYDSDFNPQNDLQAIARAHRIGQKEEVKIFRFVSSSSVDEDIIQRAKNKMVLDHLVIQNMDTSGKSVVGQGGGSGMNLLQSGPAPKIQSFGKEELNLILKFGAQDLFKEEDTEQEKEVNLDAILESAEMREEEEAPQSAANAELLSAFKCTTLTFEETEKEMEAEKPEVLGWNDIIPESMVEMHREKKGAEIYSDPEELFNPIAKRRKKRMKHLLKQDADSSRDNSRAGSRAGSVINSEIEEDIGGVNYSISDDSDMSEGEKEMRGRLKAMDSRYKLNSTNSVRFREKKMVCLECGKKYVDSTALVAHMNQAHGVIDYEPTPANRIDPKDTADLEPAKKKRKRGQKTMNTRCFRCNKIFAHRLGYKLHIKKWHDGEEPPENLDPSNLAKPDDRIECLICEKKFASANGLKLHIQRIHLGMMDGDKKEGDTKEDEEEMDYNDEADDDTNSNPKDDGDEEKKEGEENGDKDGGEDGEKESKSRRLKLAEKMEDISPEDRKKIEKMYYKLRKYGCNYCQARFNNKTKLIMHEGIHQKQRKPVICPYCDKSYSRPDKLREHCLTTHPGRQVPVVPEHSIREHIRERMPKNMREFTDKDFRYTDGEFKCPECPRIYVTLKLAKEHHFSEHSRMTQCPLCPAAYNDKKGLYQHMFRKHPRNPLNAQMVNPFVMSELSHPGSSQHMNPVDQALEELQPIKLPDGSIQCPLCPKSYTSAGGFWIHKRNRHPQWFNMTSKSAGKAPTQIEQRQDRHFCKICGRSYASYASLYHHRKFMHPETVKSRGSKSSNPNSPSAISAALMELGNLAHLAPKPSPMVVNVGGGMSHTCLKCQALFPSLRDLATHIEQKHQLGNEPNMGIANPLLNNIKMFGEVDIQPVFNGDGSPRKYREKIFKCPHCGKGYSDADRLKNHVHDRHTAKFFDDIEPNTDVCVKNHHSKLGYEIYKILCVYTTGLRMKGAKFKFDEEQKNWRLTEHIDKHVSKRDVVMILTTMKRVGERRYKLDDAEFLKMTTTVNRMYMEQKNLQEADVEDMNGDGSAENGQDDEEEPISDPLAIHPVANNGSGVGNVNNSRVEYANDDFEDEDENGDGEVETIGDESEGDEMDGEEGDELEGEEDEGEDEEGEEESEDYEEDMEDDSDEGEMVMPTPASATTTTAAMSALQPSSNSISIQPVFKQQQATTNGMSSSLIMQNPSTVTIANGNTSNNLMMPNMLATSSAESLMPFSSNDLASLNDLESIFNP